MRSYSFRSFKSELVQILYNIKTEFQINEYGLAISLKHWALSNIDIGHYSDLDNESSIDHKQDN